MISGDDGNRYSFSMEDVKGDMKISRASKVDFAIDAGAAKEIYRAVGAMDSIGAGQKNKFVAGILAIIFGAIGVHKFYLGRKKQGIIMLSTWFISLILIMTMIGAVIGGPVIWILYIIGFVEGVIMLIKPQDEFERIYIDEAKAWF